MVTGQMSDGEIEGLLSGASGDDPDLAEIRELLNTLREQGVPAPEADYTELYAAAVRETRLTPIERFTMGRVPAGRDRRIAVVQRVAVPIAALGMLVALTGGLAYAANGAKPGDFLYGLDRAIEALGIGDGGSDERLAEVLALAALEADGFEAGLTAASAGIGLDPAEPGEERAASEPAEREPLELLAADEPSPDPESSTNDVGLIDPPLASTGDDPREGGGSTGELVDRDAGAGDPPADDPPPQHPPNDDPGPAISTTTTTSTTTTSTTTTSTTTTIPEAGNGETCGDDDSDDDDDDSDEDGDDDCDD